MYEDFFGLKGHPFELSPDPFFLFSSERTREALASVSYAVARRKGFVVITGEVGTGKTLMLRCLFELWEREQIPFAYIIAPRLSTVDFLSYITSELGIKITDSTKGNLLRSLYGFLLDQFERGLTTVLVIDEAHQIPQSVLEEIRMLANFETAEQKLIQVLLVGQPELDKKLDSFELRSLKQRIAARCHLQPLSEEEIGRYVERRLELSGAGAEARSIFPVETIHAINRHSEGVPRLVNSICDRALILAYTRKVRVVVPEMVDEVASHFRLSPRAGLRQRPKPVLVLNQIEDSGPEVSSDGLPAGSLPAVEIRHPEPMSSPPNPPSSPEPSKTPAFVSTVNQTGVEKSAWVSLLTGGSSVLTPSDMPLSVGKPGVDSAMVFDGDRATYSFGAILKRIWRSRSRGSAVAQESQGRSSSLIRRAILVTGVTMALGGIAAAGGYLFRSQGQTFVSADALRASPTPPTEIATTVETPPPAGLPTERERSQPSPSLGAPVQRVGTPDLTPEVQRSSLTIANLSRPVRKMDPLASTAAEPPLIISGPVSDFVGSGNASSLLEGSGATPAPAPVPAPAPASVRPAVGGRLEPPKLISSRSPVYPPTARAQRIQGGVVLEALVDENGTVTETTVLSGPVLLHGAAIDAVRAWKYQPARMNGQPVPIHVRVRVQFALN